MAVDKALRSGSATSSEDEQVLIDRWITVERPSKVYVTGYAVEVWALLAAARSSETSIETAARWYDVPVEAVQAAFAYYHQHPLQIDAKLEDKAWDYEHDGVPAERKELGTYIVADPRICHGRLTFRGTRIFVADVLDHVARGIPWETISSQWGEEVSAGAIAEAVRLARGTFLEHEVAPTST